MIMLIISWILFGGIVGLIARAIFPGPQGMGAWATIGLGIVGSFVGGVVANLVFGGEVFAMHAAGWIGSILGALIVLALMGFSSRSGPLND